MGAHKRARRLSAELREAIDEMWEVELAAYCRTLHERLVSGEDPIVVQREFNAIRRLNEAAQGRREG